jgi:lipoate-protein ligase A
MEMHGKNIYKAGKLLRIDLEYDANTIQSIRITGDFFLYPEEGIERLQTQLVGAPLEKEKLAQRIGEIFVQEKMEAFGFNAEQLAEAIIGACKV